MACVGGEASSVGASENGAYIPAFSAGPPSSRRVTRPDPCALRPAVLCSPPLAAPSHRRRTGTSSYQFIPDPPFDPVS
ncbi:hypothetical protein GGP85_002514 [Salinibacter ruber]|nr:hypothetical protein [Salinibacter ruber]MCS3827049.1 hypothetical protein [Salinibacter ruber]MCS4145695.1 hypothetical protein [Salinibacter ruber]